MHLELTKNSATIVTVICLPHIVLSFHSNYSHPLAPHKTSVTEYPLQIGKFEMHSEILSILKINEILQILIRNISSYSENRKKISFICLSFQMFPFGL